MENKLYRVSIDEAKLIKKDYLLKEDIYSWDDYINKIKQIFHFPTSKDNKSGYIDWMDDLSWLNKEGYVFFIYQKKF